MGTATTRSRHSRTIPSGLPTKADLRQDCLRLERLRTACLEIRDLPDVDRTSIDQLIEATEAALQSYRALLEYGWDGDPFHF